MKKKILIGSLLVLTLLLLMPSIPAIQLNTVKNNAISDLVEAKDFDELFVSIREKLTSIDEGGDIGVLTPGLWLLLLIYDIIFYIIQLIKDGELLSEIIKIFFLIPLVLLMPIMNIRLIIFAFLGDFIPWEYDEGILFFIYAWLGNIVFPDLLVVDN